MSAILSRQQQWYINHQSFRKSIASGHIQAKDTTTRPSKLLEEKSWIPLEIKSNHQSKFQKLAANVAPKNNGSQAVQLAEWSFVNKTSVREYLSNKSNEPRNYSNNLKLDFDPPFRIKVN